MPGIDNLGVEWASEQMAEWAAPEDVRRLLEEPGASIQDPGSSTEESPSIWAVALRSPVETQIESTLTALAMLIARRGLSGDLAGAPVDSLPEKAARVDAETTKLVEEQVRNHGWRDAARTVLARAQAAGFSLHVTYASPLFTARESSARMPLSRHVYNSFPGARSAIDQIVNVLTQGWTLAGPIPEEILQTTRDMFETSGIPALTAHSVRDGLVCGVGALALSSVPVKNPWILRPEQIESLEGEAAVIATTQGIETIRPVLTMTGLSQIDSSLGLSLLEPLVVSSSHYDLHVRVMLSAKIMMHLPLDRKQIGDWPERSSAYAEAQLLGLKSTVEKIFNAASLRLPSPTSSIYLPGRDLMSPDASSISLGTRS